MEDHRKLIKFGKSSYVVSLPAEWIKKNKLDKGDLIFISENINNELVFSIGADKTIESRKQIIIGTDGKDLSRVKREFISAYLNNYSTIKVSGGLVDKQGKELRDTIKNLMALEVIDESSKQITVKDFLDIKEVTFREIVRKMDMITKSMMNDIKDFGKDGMSKDIVTRDEQVNRMMYLIIRIMRFTLDRPDRANKENRLRMADILNVWDITLNIESIADDIKRTARGLGAIQSDKNVSEILMKIFEDIKEFYWETMNGYYKNDLETAHNLSFKKRKLADRCNEMHEKYWSVKGVPIILENFKNIVSSTHNICRRIYS